MDGKDQNDGVDIKKPIKIYGAVGYRKQVSYNRRVISH